MVNIQIPNYLRETSLIQSRLLLASFVVVLLLGLLSARLFYLQIVKNEHFVTLSKNNRIHLTPIPPVRGLIYDRTGEVLAQNFPIYNLEVISDKVKDMPKMLDELGQLVQLGPKDLDRFRSTLRRRPSFESQLLRTKLSDEEAARFAVNRHHFPGVELHARLQRYYPLGELTAHIVGYVGRISEKDLDNIDRTAYRGTDYIGKIGIESRYEKALLGEVGHKQVETNAHGRVVRLLSRNPPVSGQNLYLSIDIRLQEMAYKAIGEYEGAVVAIEPKTGNILALVSNPFYDPNPFVNGIDERAYNELRNSKRRPLLNRALQGRYAPGSTIKGLVALAGLENGRNPRTAIFDPGWFSLNNSTHRYRCWKKTGHGSMSMYSAIVQSCDVYFYQLAHSIGIKRLHRFLSQFGLGQRTGIDLEQEPTGLMPSPAWKRRARGQPWYPGETVITGIGQGYMLATPLQLASVTATLAMRGKRMRPRLVSAYGYGETESRMELAPVPLEPVKLRNPRNIDLIIKAMTAVVHGPRGTARRIGHGSPYRIAGKTGTAQVIGIAQGAKYDEKKIPKRFRDHALFIAFAPVDDPKIAVAVVAENGGGGSKTAAPIAKKILDYYLLRSLLSKKESTTPQTAGG